LAKALLEPTFDGEELEKAREELIARIKAVEDDGVAFAGREFQRAVYGDQGYGRPSRARSPRSGGSRATRSSRGTARRCVPTRTVIAVAGDVDAEVAIALVERRFGPLATPRDAGRPKENEAARAADVLIDRPREQVLLPPRPPRDRHD